MVNKEDLKRLTTTATIDDTREYKMVAELQTTVNKFNTKVFPSLEVIIPNRQPIRLGGNIIYREGRRAEFDLNLENLSKQPMTVNGI